MPPLPPRTGLPCFPSLRELSVVRELPLERPTAGVALGHAVLRLIDSFQLLLGNSMAAHQFGFGLTAAWALLWWFHLCLLPVLLESLVGFGAIGSACQLSAT